VIGVGGLSREGSGKEIRTVGIFFLEFTGFVGRGFGWERVQLATRVIMASEQYLA
jgi:hypothetical protein